MIIADLKVIYCVQDTKDGAFYQGCAQCKFFDYPTMIEARFATIYGSTKQEMRNDLRVQLENIVIGKFDSAETIFNKSNWLQKVVDECECKVLDENKYWDSPFHNKVSSLSQAKSVFKYYDYLDSLGDNTNNQNQE